MALKRGEAHMPAYTDLAWQLLKDRRCFWLRVTIHFGTKNVLALLLISATVLHGRSNGTQQLNVRPSSGEDVFPCLPEHYYLRISPDDQNVMYDGSETITVTCKRPTRDITLHFTGSIDRVKIASCDNRCVMVRKASVAQGFLNISLKETLQTGICYNISMIFKNQIRTNGYKGFFKVRDNDGLWLLSTQFQLNDARTVFPCFDVPGLKTTYSLVLTRRPEYTTLSNMPLLWTGTRANGTRIDVYETSVPMSSYLVAFAFTQFQSKEEGIVRLHAQQSTMSNTGLIRKMLDSATYFLQYYENYFDIKYPLSKLDILFVPRQRHAMENYGLITMPDPFNTTHPIATMSHEIGHQWLGNLVTPADWKYLWLSEGIVSWYSVESLNEFDHELYLYMKKRWMNKVVKCLEKEINNPVALEKSGLEDISSFYNKGYAIFNLLTTLLTDHELRYAMQNYMRKYAFQNVVTSNLINELQNAKPSLDIDLMKMIEPWLHCKGYPILTITRQYSENGIALSQTQAPVNGTVVSEFCLWNIPLSFTNGKERNFEKKVDSWLNTPFKTISYEIDDETWLIANIQATGYYRVNYDLKNWYMLLNMLISDPEAIHEYNRIQIKHDLKYFIDSGIIQDEHLIKLYKDSEKNRERASLEFISRNPEGKYFRI